MMVRLSLLGHQEKKRYMADLEYSEAIQTCAEMYERTYGCKTVDIMVQKKNEFDKYVRWVSEQFVAPVQQVITDSSNLWSKLHSEKLEQDKKIR